MSLIDYYNNGTIKQFVDKGLISVNVLAYFDYYLAFQAHRKTCSYREAVLMTSLEFKVSESTIENAIRKLKE